MPLYCLRNRTQHQPFKKSSRDGATGVKQLSTLAARGKMLLNQRDFTNTPALQGDSHWGQRSFPAAMEAICFVVRAQQVSQGRGKTSQNISPDKKIAPGSMSGIPTTHRHSLTTHVTTSSVYLLLRTFTEFCLLRSFVLKNCPDAKKKKEKRKAKKEQPSLPLYRPVFVVVSMS